MYQVPQGWRFPAGNLIELCHRLDTEGAKTQNDLAKQAVFRVASALVEFSVGTGGERRVKKAWDSMVPLLSSRQVGVDSLNMGRTVLTQCLSLLYEIQECMDQPNARKVPIYMDLDMKVYFGFDPETPEWAYARLYTERNELRNLWKSLSGAEPYAWWSGQDPDDLPYGLSTEEWENRGRVWNRVLGTLHRPLGKSLSWSLNHTPLWNAILEPERDGLGAEDVASLALQGEDGQRIYRLLRTWLNSPLIASEALS